MNKRRYSIMARLAGDYRLQTAATAEQALDIACDMLDEMECSDYPPGAGMAEIYVERIWPDERLVYTD